MTFDHMVRCTMLACLFPSHEDVHALKLLLRDGQCLLAENMGLSIDAWAAGVQSALAVWQEMLPIPVPLGRLDH